VWKCFEMVFGGVCFGMCIELAWHYKFTIAIY